MDIQHIMVSFEGVSTLFLHRFMEPLWSKYPNVENDIWDSLRLFLWGYAFLRQGSSNDYAPVAIDVINEISGKSLDVNTTDLIWDSFKSKKKEKFNYANNPLCPQGTAYKRQYRGKLRESKVNGISIIELLKPEFIGKRSLVNWVKESLDSGDVKDAHKDLRRVNGVSHKIASLFLRDVAIKYQVFPDRDRYLLQPIDVWVRKVVTEIRGGDPTDSVCARYLVQNSKHPELVNQGIWYFCTQMAFSSNYKVMKALKELRLFRQLVHQHVQWLIRDGEITNRYASKWQSILR